jgi:Lhr-like helicase
MLGAVPSQECVIAERFFDEAGGMQLIIHAPFGARINRAWGLALRNASAGRSISNCRRRRPTTVAALAERSAFVSRSKSCSVFSARTR